MEVGLPGNKNFAILIQARLHSTRLPGKILFKFFDDTIIERIIKIAKKVSIKKNIFIISGNKKKNKILSDIAKENSISIYYNNEENVFLRFKNFLKSNLGNKFEYVLRITSDNYLIQPQILKIMINDTIKAKIDYAYVDPLSHYAGEMISKKLMFQNTKISEMAKKHVTWDFRRNKKIKFIKYSKKLLGLNHSKSLTLDNIADLIKMKKIEKKFNSLKEINNYKYLKKIQNKFKNI
jgi:spore coat polysaccharide biosynthesis protein SpsF (cytidylyltransferase family)